MDNFNVIYIFFFNKLEDKKKMRKKLTDLRS